MSMKLSKFVQFMVNTNDGGVMLCPASTLTASAGKLNRTTTAVHVTKHTKTMWGCVVILGLDIENGYPSPKIKISCVILEQQRYRDCTSLLRRYLAANRQIFCTENGKCHCGQVSLCAPAATGMQLLHCAVVALAGPEISPSGRQ